MSAVGEKGASAGRRESAGRGGQGECLREGWWSAARDGAFHHFSGFEQYLVAYALA